MLNRYVTINLFYGYLLIDVIPEKNYNIISKLIISTCNEWATVEYLKF